MIVNKLKRIVLSFFINQALFKETVATIGITKKSLR